VIRRETFNYSKDPFLGPRRLAVRISDFPVLTFDCYGTLIDWETGIADHLGRWAERHGSTARAQDLLTAFSRAETRVQSERPSARYRDVLREVYREIAVRFGVDPDTQEADDFAASVGNWPPFPDTKAALTELKKRYKLVVVSNVDRESFSRTLPKLGVELDALVNAEDVGAYKPDLRMFERTFEIVAEMGFDRSKILHVAQSLYHDHVPAAQLGLRTVWVNRRKGKDGWGATRQPDTEVTPDIEVASLSELVALDDAQRKAEKKGETSG
jgi:2-haloalkanoic acid dehalogenase type II